MKGLAGQGDAGGGAEGRALVAEGQGIWCVRVRWAQGLRAKQMGWGDWGLKEVGMWNLMGEEVSGSE